MKVDIKISETHSNFKSKVKLKKSRFRVIKQIVNYGILPISILVLWEILTRLNVFPPILLPSVEDVVRSFIEQLSSGQLLGDLSVSLIRVLKGYSIAIILGLSLGVFMGVSLRASKFFTIVFDGIRQVPPMAWIPLLILWFGIGETSKIVMIAKSAFFPILLNTINGIRNTPKGYLEVAKMYNIKKRDLFTRVYFPSAVPSIFVGLRLGAGASWMAVVAAELIASDSGIGYRINDARSLMQPDVVIVGMIVIGTVGMLMDLILKRVAKLASRWQIS
ncbi:MAG: ABC transporter permease [Bacillota bacterium]|nr:ABC transporter permease [Bacillota bacterium]